MCKETKQLTCLLTKQILAAIRRLEQLNEQVIQHTIEEVVTSNGCICNVVANKVNSRNFNAKIVVKIPLEEDVFEFTLDVNREQDWRACSIRLGSLKLTTDW